MTTKTKSKTVLLGTLLTTIGVASFVSIFSQPVRSSGEAMVKIDGSSTVAPITQAIVQEFNKKQPAQISVNVSGTSGGFQKFCKGETDINNASRPILRAEMELCNQNKVRFIELPIAFDALTVVVNPQNNWAKDITVEELRKMWEAEAQGNVTTWNQVRSTWPAQPLKLYGPGKDSGTFDYFTEAVTGVSGNSRKDFTASEDDQVLVDGVSKNPNALGYFGFAFYEKNQQKLTALPVDNGNKPVAPTRENVENATYQPLSRPLFIYVNVDSAQDKQQVQNLVEFYIEQAPNIVKNVGYIPLPEEGYHIAEVNFNRGKVGTVFDGKTQINLTIGELLRQEAKF